MPAERISRGFYDLSMSFDMHPINHDIIGLKNENAIARSLRNLVLTSPGERFFQPILGTNMNRTLFENMHPTTAILLRDEITNTIKNYEPRVALNSVEVTPDYESYQYDVSIDYKIVGIDVLPQKLSFVLQATR
jgi:phage baseplate assembly protein W